MRKRFLLPMALTVALAPLPAAAQAPAQPALRGQPQQQDDTLARAAQRLPALLADGADLAAAFSPEFISAIPLEQVRAITASLRTQHGEPQSAGPVQRAGSAGNGVVIITYERADVTMALAIDANGRISGLQITDVTARGDTIDRLTRDLAALPGNVGWGLYRLRADAGPAQIAGAGDTQSLAIGSSFKLAVLATLDSEIAAGRMRWTDVITLTQSSVPSGMMQDWPLGSPITLQTAAQMMIAISDNTATDLLIRHLGRERIEAFARAHGGLSGEWAFPLLMTVEATVLKNPALGQARSDWLAGNETERRAVLARHAPLFVPGNVDYAAFARPADISRIEWFASTDSMASLLNWYAHRASDTARAIIAVNPGLPAGNARQWTYVGYKGGSEPGVIAMNLLLRGSDGATYAVVMSWNNEAASVDEARLAGLAARAAALLRQPAAP